MYRREAMGWEGDRDKNNLKEDIQQRTRRRFTSHADKGEAGGRKTRGKPSIEN